MDNRSDWLFWDQPLMDWWGALWRDMLQGQAQMGDAFKWMGQDAYEDYLRLWGLKPGKEDAALTAQRDELTDALSAREEQIELQKKQMAELQALSDTHEKKLIDQKKRNAAQARTITTQKKQMERLKEEVVDLKARLSDQKKEMAAQKKDFASMEKALLLREKALEALKRSRSGSEKGLPRQAPTGGTV
jgi:DNA repair exonuclease SbcCD ATPase subunit